MFIFNSQFSNILLKIIELNGGIINLGHRGGGHKLIMS